MHLVRALPARIYNYVGPHLGSIVNSQITVLSAALGSVITAVGMRLSKLASGERGYIKIIHQFQISFGITLKDPNDEAEIIETIIKIGVLCKEGFNFKEPFEAFGERCKTKVKTAKTKEDKEFLEKTGFKEIAVIEDPLQMSLIIYERLLDLGMCYKENVYLDKKVESKSKAKKDTEDKLALCAEKIKDLVNENASCKERGFVRKAWSYIF
jgi:hypothetical protein